MKTILALEELIRSYNGISALDSFKAMDCIRILKELDVKYQGFGEDVEILSKQLLRDMTEDTETYKSASTKRYFSFEPTGYNLINQSSNCLLELNNYEVKFFISDKQVKILYEMISDIFEYGEISEEGLWELKDSGINMHIHDVSNNKDCVMSLWYDSNLCDILNGGNGGEIKIDKSTEIVLNISTEYLVKVLSSFLFRYHKQEVACIPLPKSKKLSYSDTLCKILSCSRYFNVLSKLNEK